VADLRTRLTLSNHETDALHSLLAARDAVLGGRGGVDDAHDFESLPLAARVRWMARPGFDAALAVVAAEAPDLAARVRADADRELPDRRLPAPLLDGNALLAAGFRAGPRFKVLLDLALDAQIEGRVRTTADALELARAAEATAP
jgi:poly(A) polymerase